jgi:hypothetical protein
MGSPDHRVPEREEGNHPYREEEMSEHHRIVGEARGEPLPAGSVGIRVRIPLSGCPSRRWSRDLSARLSNELVGHDAVGHLRLNDIVQGDQLVLDGVEASEAPALAEALGRAVGATNEACPDEAERTSNVARGDAQAIAHQVTPRTS